jgi:hypothetical protein
MQKVPNLKLGFIKPLHNIINKRFSKAPTNEEKWGHAPKYRSTYTILASSWRVVSIYIYIFLNFKFIIIFISAVKILKILWNSYNWGGEKNAK